MNQSYSKFIKYYHLNEISKFSNFNNLHSLSNIQNISVWYSIDFSLEKSKLISHSKSLLGIFLIYLITNKCPKIQSTKDRRILHIESDLNSLDLKSFLNKFLIFYDSIERKKVMQNYKTDGKVIRCLVTDLSFFTELDGFFPFFKLINWLCIDIHCNHEEDYRNHTFIHNLVKSSLFI
jgi:hypothetical protein